MSRLPGPMSVPRLRLRITAAAESILRSGHPWLFAESIREQNRPGMRGEIAVIYDRKNRFLAAGLFDPESPIRLRVLQAIEPAVIDGQWWQCRLAAALAQRKGLFSPQTTGYRWINGESDGWPALVVDRYDATLVLKVYSGAWLVHLDEIANLIETELKPERLVLRLSRNMQEIARRDHDKRDGQVLFGEPPARPVIFRENSLQFESDVLRGQKTGFFLDQRENRREVGALCAGRRVLNAFSFSGGFSVYAAKGGATHVTDLDISEHALAAARRNFEMNRGSNRFVTCDYAQIQTDAFEFLARTSRPAYDLIVLDPPSLAKREAERAGALTAYGRLVSSALKHLRRAGILVACSCSAHVGPEEFFSAVREAAGKAGRKFGELQRTGHPADHPARFKEANYLKAIYLRFE